MSKNEIKATLTAFYNRTSYAHSYIYGFRFKGIIYFVIVKAQMLDHLTKLDKASRGAGYSLRFKPDRTQKNLLMTCEPIALCSEEFFEELCKVSQYNRGEIFEKLITEYFGQTWVKDNIPYTEAGDIEVDGIAYQIKFEKATFITEAQMMRMRAEA
jgi:hypothetical protein